MYLIGICSIVSLAIFFERFFYLKKTESDDRTFFGNLYKKLESDNIPDAIHLCDHSKGILSADILKPALMKANSSRSELKEYVGEAVSREIPKLESKIPVLGTIASIAPLLGLLGTVLGMINTISVYEQELSILKSSTAGLQTTSSLLNGIWSALITTAAGLIVAIPSLSAYNYLVTKVNNLIELTRAKANDIIELVIIKSSS